jgi:hypothetical protein
MTPITGYNIAHDEFLLEPNGKLTIYKGFSWDGASGPTFDTKNSMRPSLFHDCFCLMLRAKMIDYDQWQDTVNQFFKQQCLEEGMWAWRAHLWYLAVEFSDAGGPNQGEDRKTLVA